MGNNYLKEEYLAKAKEDRKPYKVNTMFSLQMILKLRDMAEHDVYPDGHFGDDECVLWGILHRVSAPVFKEH